MNLISHIRGESDILEPWAEHYVNLGVERFHIICHGSAQENWKISDLQGRYPITIVESYEGPFQEKYKLPRLEACLKKLVGKWVIVVDADEFLELPYDSLNETIRALENFSIPALYAPMLQRIRADGLLTSPPSINDISTAFPLCSPNLYAQMKASASLDKFPLFRVDAGTSYRGGNHASPNGYPFGFNTIRGVLHHFKWRQPVLNRFEQLINEQYKWHFTQTSFQQYLLNHNGQLPLEGSFVYSRQTLFERGFLRYPVHASPLSAKERMLLKVPISAQRTAYFKFLKFRRTAARARNQIKKVFSVKRSSITGQMNQVS